VSERNFKAEINDAAAVKKNVDQFIKEQLANVASGNSLKSRIEVFPESRFPKWATTLASILCADPKLANENNKKLATLIESETGESGFDYTIISKKLSEGQRRYAGEILRNNGYATDTLVKGTDIKRIVKHNIRNQALKDDGVVFYADGVSIVGKRYAYRQRAVTPNGTPWHDFCIRLAGDDTSLQALLAARNIGVNDFMSRDEAARVSASPEEAERRHKLDRPAMKSRRLAKVLAQPTSNGNETSSTPDLNATPKSRPHFRWTFDGLMDTGSCH